jgi:Flp pilus assembly protein TadB
MGSLLFSPVFFYGQILLVLVIALLLGAMAAGRGERHPDVARRPSRLAPLLEREGARAVALGWSPRTWLWLRAASVVVGVVAGIVIGTPVVIVGCAVVGVFVVPFLLGPLSDKRRLQMERALVDQVRAIVDLIRTSNQTLDEALTDAGANPLPIVRPIMRPLADTQQSIRDRLIEVDRRALSPIANRMCADLLLSLDTSPEAFVIEATEVLIPQYESDLTIQERNHAIAQGSRQAGYIVAGLMGFMFIVVMHVDNFRAAYSRPLGQIVLVVIAGLVMLIFWIIGHLTPRTQWVRWNLDEIKAQLERRYA